MLRDRAVRCRITNPWFACPLLLVAIIASLSIFARRHNVTLNSPFKKKGIWLVLGTRPEGVKLAPVVLKLRGQNELCFVLSTGQHQTMLSEVLETFQIKADVDLALMTVDQSLSGLSVKLLVELSNVYATVEPRIVVVQGDTTTAMVAALAAFYLKIPVAHIEAGLRTHDLYNPFPEELNRHMIGVIANYHFAATPSSRENLVAENVPVSRIWVTGNTVIDALFVVAESQPSVGVRALLERIDSHGRLVILVTAHRRENHESMDIICAALAALASSQNVLIVFPVHLSPHVRSVAFRRLGSVSNILLLDPQPYDAMVHLMKRSYAILTDSGGIQEEAIALQKPVVVLRDSTERPEGVAAGCAVLVGTNIAKIVETVSDLIVTEARYRAMSRCKSLYGDGRAANRIVAVLTGGIPEE